MYIYIYHISTWLFAFRVGREEHQTDLDWALWFCWSRCCHMRLAAPSPRQHSRNMCCSVFSVYTFVFGISLSVFLTLSLSLPPGMIPLFFMLSLSVSQYSLLDLYVCLLCESVFDSEKKRASVQVQGNSWYQGVESLSHTLSLTHSLSHFLSISLSSLSEIRVVHWKLCRQSICNPVSMCLSSDFETPR